MPISPAPKGLRAYQAVAKMLGIVNSMTNTLMNMMGVVTT